MDVDGLTAAEPERSKRPWLILAAIVPLALIVTGVAWFIRTYVAPPTVAISAAPPVLASAEPVNVAPATAGPSLRSAIVEQPTTPAEPPPAASAFPPPAQPEASAFRPPPGRPRVRRRHRR